MPLKLRSEGAEMLTNEEPPKRNCHSENHKSEIDGDSNNSVAEIRQRLGSVLEQKKNCILQLS